MRAIQIIDQSGPESALELVEIAEPECSHMLTPGEGVLVDVHAAGVSFPEVLQTRGLYQIKPPLPFVPGSEVAGIVRSAPSGASVRAGDRVAAFCMLGAFAQVAVAPAHFTFRLPEALDFRQGAGLVLNYHTAYFALVTRGRLTAGETVLVHGAAGGVGTAVLQVARGLGARTIAVVSTGEKERVARDAGADHVLRSERAVEGRVPGARRRRRRHRSGRRLPLHRQHPVAEREGVASSSSASPRARFRRSGSTACCSATPRSSAPAGARAAIAKPAFVREVADRLADLIEAGLRGADRRRRLPAGAGGRCPDADRLTSRRRQGSARRRLR